MTTFNLRVGILKWVSGETSVLRVLARLSAGAITAMRVTFNTTSATCVVASVVVRRSFASILTTF